MEFHMNLEKALTASKKTQQDLAGYLGVTQATISRWINGKCEPDLKTFLEICTYLDETPNSLLGYDEFLHAKHKLNLNL